ncbi:hypothetical protein M3Y98_00515400 [Aphelenchoides besseyi]|nr:hypothetical protein M3Y98_00515400 [Aphelenchoides besseyi]KAI6203262.1 hypothetical protein M3Y94_00536000 [Aphelenchoides besseyi]KAI6207893.1 hypothetical protein M3Y96_00057200 [Aphelenchoides besseyi]KAI6225813.1 hypothetical protein M3Y95_00736700 [Aphelenchoides besseyi]
MTAKLRQHSLSSLVHDCNVHLASLRFAVQAIGTSADGSQLRRDIENCIKTCIRSFEATKNCVLPHLKHEGVEFTKHASQFIGCVSACIVEMRRCAALERTFPVADAPPLASPHIAFLEQILESLENLITVHYSTSESAPEAKVTPRRSRGTICRPSCICNKLKTSYA